MKKNILLLVITLTLFSCMDRVETMKIKIINHSRGTVYCFKSMSDSLSKSKNVDFTDSLFDVSCEVKKDSTYLVGNVLSDWGIFIDDCDDKKLRLFIISKDSIDKYGWTQVLKENIYSKVYKLDMNGLKREKWAIIYP